MVPLPSLWLPILLSGVFVFVGSSVIHMFLSYHKNDFRKLPDEDAAMNALRPLSIPPGDYVMPYAGGSEHLKSDAFKAKVEKGPVAVMTVYAPGDFFNMGFVEVVFGDGDCVRERHRRALRRRLYHKDDPQI